VRCTALSWAVSGVRPSSGVSVRTISRCLRRYREEGEQGLLDRSSAPSPLPARTPEDRMAVISALRRLRMTATEIAEALSMPLSTVAAVLTQLGLGKLSWLEPPSWQIATSGAIQASSSASTSRSLAGSRTVPASASSATASGGRTTTGVSRTEQPARGRHRPRLALDPPGAADGPPARDQRAAPAQPLAVLRPRERDAALAAAAAGTRCGASSNEVRP